MNNNTFAQGLAIMKMAFPGFDLDRASAALWFKTLKDLSDLAFCRAVNKLIMTTDRTPTIAAIRKAAMNEEDDSVGPEDAWQKVIDDVHRYGIYKEPEYDDLRLEKTKRTIGWRELCDMDSDSRRIIRAQFFRVFEAYDRREKSKALTGSKDGVNHEVLARLFGGMLPGEKKAG